MSETKKGIPMPGIEAVLRDWPEAESASPDAWDQRAKSVMSRLGERATSASSVSDDELFADPFGLAEDERDERVEVSKSRERDRKNLQDLAKMAQGLVAEAKAPSATEKSEKTDSGIVDLAAAAKADPGAVVRAQTTPLASESLFEDAAPVQQPAPSVAPRSLPNVRPITSAPKKNNGVVLALGGLLAMAGVAAGGFLYVHAHDTPASAPPVVATVAPQDVAPAASASAPEVAAQPMNLGTDLNALPAATAMASGRPHRHAAADDSAVAVAPKPASKPGADVLMPPPAGPPDSLSAAMQGAVGEDKNVRPAAASNGSASMGNVPQKPSQGAVSGALGAVLPGARSCLGPDDPISRAAVVFNSDGSVANVTVTGGAVGRPAESCIVDKLKAAKLQPFAEPTYTANITIRHN